jgi:hypothetical protein
VIRIGALLLSLLASSGGEARAAPLTVGLDYTAGPGCPDAADFRAAVTARLGYDPFVDGAPERVLVRIDPRDRAIDGRIEWRSGSGQWAGEQLFPSVTTDCPRLVRAMGFALAVQIQLLAKAAAAPEVDVMTPAEAAIPSPKAPPVVTATAAPEATTGRPRPALAVGAGPSVGLGLSSSPVLLGRLFGAVAWPHVSLELAAAVSLPTTTRRADGAGVSQQILLGGAAGCATAARWSGCLVASAGAVRMAGEDIDRVTSATVPLVQAGARLAIKQDLGRRAFVNARADGLVNLIRWTGSLDQVPVWTAPRFSATIGVDAGVRLP